MFYQYLVPSSIHLYFSAILDYNMSLKKNENNNNIKLKSGSLNPRGRGGGGGGAGLPTHKVFFFHFDIGIATIKFDVGLR